MKQRSEVFMKIQKKKNCGGVSSGVGGCWGGEGGGQGGCERRIEVEVFGKIHKKN